MRFAAVLLLLFFASSCRKNPIVAPPPKDPRTYTWTIDTLEYPGSLQTTMRDIWGSSPTDVYAVGDGGINAGNMWHFDGTVWSPINLPFGSFALWKIHGFSLNNIYAAGVRFYQTGWDSSGNPVVSDSSLLIHFDGTQWSEVKHNPRSAFLLGLWGNSPLDIWAGGLGALYHYDSTGWNRLSYPSDFAIQDITGFSSKDVYFLSYYYPSSAYFYWSSPNLCVKS